MNIKKIFPKNKKNVSTDDVIKKTIIDSFNVFFESILDVRTTKSGIKDKGSMATNVFNKF
jgi:hypothetical protein|tara:strand:- start:66 stop:245 length:180 start_codon:yes stop_codon:yes gene_type:complete